MALFSRFGNAFGELGTHLKGNGFARAWKKGGALAAGKSVLGGISDATVNWAGNYPNTKGLVDMSSKTLQLRHPGVLGFAGGAIAGGGSAALLNRRDRGHRSVVRGAAFGAVVGAGAGTGYMLTRYNEATGTFGNLRGAPGAFMRGLRA